MSQPSREQIIEMHKKVYMMIEDERKAYGEYGFLARKAQREGFPKLAEILWGIMEDERKHGHLLSDYLAKYMVYKEAKL
jgi:rubrerythrin